MKKIALTLTALILMASFVSTALAANDEVISQPQAVAQKGDITLVSSPIAVDDVNGDVYVKLYLLYKTSSLIDSRNLSFFEISPVVDDTEKFPFQITWTSYAQGMGDQKEDPIDITKPIAAVGANKRYFGFSFKTKKDVINGYYPITFLVKYLHDGQSLAYIPPVEDTVTVYVQITHGKDPATPTPEPTATPTPEPTPEATPKPQAKVILQSFSMNPEDVVGGDTFELTLVLENTNQNMATRNMRCTLEDTDGMVLPVSGSSTFYIDRIAAGGTSEVTLKMRALPEAGIKPVKMSLDIQYDDNVTSGVTAKETFTLPIHQVIRLEYDDPYLPAQVYVDEPFDVSFTFRNTGKAAMYNTLITLESETMRADASLYVGTMEAGSQRVFEPYVTISSDRLQFAEVIGGEYQESLPMDEGFGQELPVGDPDDGMPDEDGNYGAVRVGDYAAIAISRPVPAGGVSSGKVTTAGGEGEYAPGTMLCKGNIVITYEDNLGQSYRKEIPLETGIRSFDQEYTYDSWMNTQYDPVTGYPIDPVTGQLIDPMTGLPIERGMAPWVIVSIAAGAVALVAAAVVIIRVMIKRKRRKMEMEMENEVE